MKRPPAAPSKKGSNGTYITTYKLTKKEEGKCYIQSRASGVNEDTICRAIQSNAKRLYRKKDCVGQRRSV